MVCVISVIKVMTPIGKMATASSGLGVTFTIDSNPNNVMHLLGNGPSAQLVFSKNFTDLRCRFLNRCN